MALNFRQNYLYRYRLSIWRQNQEPPADQTFDQDVPVLTDYGPTWTLVHEDVPAMFWSASENAGPSAIGRSREDIIFTLDRWKVPNEYEVLDQDVLVCTAGPNDFQGVGEVWTCQGDTQDHATLTVSNANMVYAKRGDNPPTGVSI